MSSRASPRRAVRPHRTAAPCVLLGLLAAPPAVLSADAPGAQGKEPVLAIADPVFNWGKAFRGEQLDHAFVVENKGTATLVIESLKPSCGCMTVANEAEYKRRLEPGEKTTVLLHIDTQILEPGAVKNKYTEVITNALGDENRLAIEGEIEALFKIVPAHPTVEVIRGGEAPSSPTAFTLETSGARRVAMASLEPRKGILASRLKELEKGRRFEVSLLPALKDMKTIFQSDDLEAAIEVDGKRVPFRIQVSIKLKDRIEVSPSQSVYFHRTDTASLSVPDGPKPSKSLEVSSIGGAGHVFKISGVAVKGGTFAARVETIEEGKRYRLTVTLEKAPLKGERFLKDSIEVTTDDPQVPVLKIPASAQF